ncbi:MAG: TolC family protein [Candidatus Latescibacteria bacterium]|nr:TolC family protein [Candidatus Latescibacterota bacterium]
MDCWIGCGASNHRHKQGCHRGGSGESEVEQSRYRVGTGRQLDVIDAQLRFTQARNDLIAALYDYKIAEASLDNAMGTTDYAVR